MGKLEREEIRIRVLGLLTQVDKSLAARVAAGLGLEAPKKPAQPVNHSFGADADVRKFQPVYVKQAIEKSAALSMANTVKNTIKTRQVAILAC